jgi:hypothetical protein
MFGALAVIETDPEDTPVTGTDTLVVPVAKVTVAGTVATAGPLELRLTINAAVAAADRFSVRFCVVALLIVRLPGEKFSVVVTGAAPPVTFTWELTVG